MKKRILMGVLAGIALVGCNQDKIDKLSNTNDSLASVIAKKDSSMALIATTLADVHSNLNYIKEREGIIAINANSEGDTNQINNDLKAIYAKLVENKNKVNELQRKLNSALGKNSEYKKIIEVLQQQIDQQNAEIEKLNNMLAEKDVEIGFLNTAVIRLSTSVDSLATVSTNTQNALDATTNELHTAYYIVAEKSKLKDKGLLEGGLFSKKVLNGSIDNSLFTKVDITEVENIPLSGRRFKVLTSHPSSSYTIDEEKKQLVIKDKKAFWSASHYLIVQARSVDED